MNGSASAEIPPVKLGLQPQRTNPPRQQVKQKIISKKIKEFLMNSFFYYGAAERT